MNTRTTRAKHALRRLVVNTLEHACRYTHPFSDRHTLANWSNLLDHRWHTGSWKPYNTDN